MIGIEEYRKTVSELLDEFPPEFFRGLTGGVIVSEATVTADYSRKEDPMYIMGQYQFSAGIRQIVMYKGSFDRVYPQADAEDGRQILRGILRHEFRHHLESLSGIHNSSSLEAEDERKRQEYISSPPD